MLICIDVDYRGDGRATHAVSAGVLFDDWQSEHSAEQLVEVIHRVEDYQPGEFYRRELPCLLQVLRRVRHQLDAVIVDGYVWLGEGQRPGLGAHLYAALDERIPVVGVAKNPFAGASPVREVKRGGSERPLYVGAAGMDLDAAADRVAGMAGEHRFPTLLKEVDRLCRDHVVTSA